MDSEDSDSESRSSNSSASRSAEIAPICCPKNKNELFKLCSYLYGLLFFLLAGIIASQMGPFFPTIAKLEKELTATSIGFISAAYDFASVISCLVLPQRIRPVDTKSLFILAVFVHGICGVFFGCMDMVDKKARFFVGCFVLRLLMGAGTSLAWFTFVPLAISWYPYQKTLVAAYIENAFAVGIVFGPAIGSWLFEWQGFAMPFVFPGLIKVVMAFFALFIIRAHENIQTHQEDEIESPDFEDPPPPYAERDPMTYSAISTDEAQNEENETQTRQTEDSAQPALPQRTATTTELGENSPLLSNSETKSVSVLDLFRHPIIIVTSLPFVASASTVGFLGVFLSPFLQFYYDISTADAALYFIITASFSVLISPIVAKLTQKSFKWLLYLTGPYLGIIGFGLMGLSMELEELHNKYLIMFCLAVIGWCYCTGYVTGFFIVNDLVEVHLDNVDSSTIKSITSAWVLVNIMTGRILGSAISGGFVLENWSYEPANFCEVGFLVVGGLFGLGSTLYFSKSYPRRENPNNRRQWNTIAEGD